LSTLSIKADTIGAAASFLCMIHCVAAPFLFVAQACAHTCCSGAPTWWRSIDFAFLFISGVAVVRATKSSASKPVQFGLWLAWGTLTLSILFETFHPALFSEWVKYSAATALIVSHFYNLKFGRCHSDSCAIHQG
jgi:hypothetical protein